jgi:hypothetical protein
MTIFEALGLEDNVLSRVCDRCYTEKPLSEFYRHRANYDSRCIECLKKYQTEVKSLKQHPSTPPKPTHCECCGREDPKGKMVGTRKQVSLCMDHSYDAEGKPFFRGWICVQCNSGIGYLGDNLQSVKKAIEYLERSEKNARPI